MSVEQEDTPLTNPVEPKKSSPYSTPIAEIAACIMSGGKILPREKGKQRAHIDPANGLTIPRRIDEPLAPGI